MDVTRASLMGRSVYDLQKQRWMEVGGHGSGEDEEARAQLLCNHGQLHGLTGNFKGASTTVFGVCQGARCWCRVNILDHLPYCFQNSTWSSSHLLWKTQWCVNYQLHKRKKKSTVSLVSLQNFCWNARQKKVDCYNQYVKIHGQCITFMASLIKNEIPSFCNTQGFSLSKMKILTAATKSSSWHFYW